jgi:hypothetical protein
MRLAVQVRLSKVKAHGFQMAEDGAVTSFLQERTSLSHYQHQSTEGG